MHTHGNVHLTGWYRDEMSLFTADLRMLRDSMSLVVRGLSPPAHPWGHFLGTCWASALVAVGHVMSHTGVFRSLDFEDGREPC
jgi:hypothetical protein